MELLIAHTGLEPIACTILGIHGAQILFNQATGVLKASWTLRSIPFEVGRLRKTHLFETCIWSSNTAELSSVTLHTQNQTTTLVIDPSGLCIHPQAVERGRLAHLP